MLYGVEHQVRPANAGRGSRGGLERLQDVEIRDPATVASVIEDVPGMLDMLVDSVAVLRTAFGPSATGIVIEPFVDPEVSFPTTRLFVRALTSLSFEDADAILERVVSDWWMENANRAEGRVTIDMEFV